MNNPHLAYRSDVDGLRAVAVLAVIAFHASARILPGGFVGVDIFFVISGFLITGLIAKGMEADRFSFAEFYTRRIKRILPAYIAVAAATLAISSWLLIPNDYIFYTTSLAASWAFAANVFFSMLSWGYFGQRTEEFPLLHTWSL
jgi:peptidoglycan/LPS O-acetylase OafA/YrhL